MTLYTQTYNQKHIRDVYRALEDGIFRDATFGRDLTVTRNLTVTGSITFGDAAVDNFIIKGRVASMTAAGSAIDIDSTYTYGEGIEIRYQVTDWTGVGSSFKGLYLRSECATNSAAAKSVYGAEIYGVCNDVTMTTGSLWGALFYAYNKGVSAVTINHMYAVQAELTWDASRTGDCTITTAAACVRAKITGGRVADYTKIHGYVLTIGEMDGDSQTFGNGILMQDDGDMSGTSTLTVGVNLTIGCTTGISMSGTCTTGISISSGSLTDAIKISGTTPVDGIEISSACSGVALNISGTNTGDAINIAGCVTGIDFTGTCSSYGIDMNSATCTTGDIRLQNGATIVNTTDVLTVTEPTLTFAGSTAINLDGPTTITGKLALDAQTGTASVSGLLIGIGTAGDPATDGTADGKFIELRCETTATSGDCRLQYMRYYMNGINATGGECLKAGTVLGAAIGTARGEQASIEVSSTGYVTGFACGLDGLLEVADSAVPSGGTYCAGQSQVYITGSSSDLSAATSHAIHRFSVAGGDATAEGKVLNAFNFDVANCVGNGLLVEEGTNLGAIKQSLRVLINNVVGYLLVYDAPA